MSLPLSAFTFYFDNTTYGLLRVHAYQYSQDQATCIVECRHQTWEKLGLTSATESETISVLQDVLGHRLKGHELIANRSHWRNFTHVYCTTWHKDNIVLLGDAAHTAHFSIGSGTKLAMEDAVELVHSIKPEDIQTSLAHYEQRRRPKVAALQKAATISQRWFETMERQQNMPKVRFALSCMTRSLHLDVDKLKERDPKLISDGMVESGAKKSFLFSDVTVGSILLPNRFVETAPQVTNMAGSVWGKQPSEVSGANAKHGGIVWQLGQPAPGLVTIQTGDKQEVFCVLDAKQLLGDNRDQVLKDAMPKGGVGVVLQDALLWDPKDAALATGESEQERNQAALRRQKDIAILETADWLRNQKKVCVWWKMTRWSRAQAETAIAAGRIDGCIACVANDDDDIGSPQTELPDLFCA